MQVEIILSFGLFPLRIIVSKIAFKKIEYFYKIVFGSTTKLSGSSVPYWPLSPHVQPVPHHQPCASEMAIYETHRHITIARVRNPHRSSFLVPYTLWSLTNTYQNSITHNSVIILRFAYSSLPTFKEFTLLQNSFQISISKQKYPPI